MIQNCGNASFTVVRITVQFDDRSHVVFDAVDASEVPTLKAGDWQKLDFPLPYEYIRPTSVSVETHTGRIFNPELFETQKYLYASMTHYLCRRLLAHLSDTIPRHHLMNLVSTVEANLLARCKDLKFVAGAYDSDMEPLPILWSRVDSFKPFIHLLAASGEVVLLTSEDEEGGLNLFLKQKAIHPQNIENTLQRLSLGAILAEAEIHLRVDRGLE